MTAVLTLTSAGTDTGPFDLYSNMDSFVVPFEIGVSKAALQAGYSTSLVPDYASTVRVKSKGECINYTDIVLIIPTTTTTSTTTTTTTLAPEVPCNATVTAGGEGITESFVNLSPLGGLITFVMGSQSIPDKLEIIHNGVKKATTGMTVANGGPFDNLYGSPTVPTVAETMSTEQFIGLNKGSIPDRQATYFAETGSTLPMPPPPSSGAFQQYVWWEYTPADYAINNVAVIRVTGPAGTAWDLQRLCPVTTTTSTTL